MPNLPVSRSMLGVSLYTYYDVLKVKIKINIKTLKMGAVVVVVAGVTSPSSLFKANKYNRK